MDKEKIFSILEIEETKDEEILKEAYRAKLVRTNPEDDPQGFVELRQAYEEAVRLASEEEKEEEPKTEVDYWIDRARKLYKSISMRCNEDAWKELLEDEVCVGLDTEAEAREKLLVMAMECCNIPHKIWLILDNEFHYLQDYDNLCEMFPKNYLDFLFGQIQYEDFIDYELFLGDDNGDVDELVNVIFRLKDCYDNLEEAIDIVKHIPEENVYSQDEIDEKFASMNELLKAADECEMKHPYVDVIKMRTCGLRGEMDEAYELMQELEDGFGDINGKEFMDNIFIKYNVSKMYTLFEREDEAFELRSEILEKVPNHRGCHMDNITYYYAKEEYIKAKDASLDFLDKFGNHPAALDYMRKTNEKIMEEYKRKADEGDIESVYDLGWCYFQNEMYDECMELITAYKPEKDDKYEFEYMNLAGRCLAASGKFEEALDKLYRWQQILYSLEDDGTEKYKKRIRRKGYSYYVIGMCMYNIWERDYKNGDCKDGKGKDFLKIVLENLQTAIQEETDKKELLYYKDRMAMTYLASEDYMKCIDICTELLNEVPQYYMAYVFRQEAFYKLDYPRNVIEDFYEAIKYYNRDFMTYAITLKTLFEYRQYEEGKKVLEIAKENQIVSDAINLFRVKFRWKEAMTNGDSQNQNAELNTCLRELYDFEEKFITKEMECDIEDKSDITYAIALINLDLGKRADGFRYLQKTVELNKEKEENVYWVLANVYSSENDYRNELKTLKKIKKIDKDNIEMCFRMGKCYWCLDENDKAKKAFDKVYKAAPEHRLINSYLTDYYVYMFRETENKANWEKALFHAKEQYRIEECPYYLIKLGQVYWEIYDLENVEKTFKEVKALDESYVDADYYLAHVAMLKWDYKEAYTILHKAIALKVDTQCINDQLIFKAMVDVCMALGRFDEAMSYIKKCHKRYQLKEWEHQQTMRVLERRGSKEARYRHINRVRMEKIADKVNPHMVAKDTAALAMVCYELGKTGQGAKEIKQAINEAGENQSSLKVVYDKCVTIFKEIMCQPKMALKYAMKSLNACDGEESISTCITIAILSAECGQKRKATSYYKKYHELIKEYYGEVKNYYTDTAPSYLRARLFKLGEFFFFMEDQANLEKCVERMSHAKPCATCSYCQCFELLILKGYLEELKGNNDEALAYFEKANVVNNYDSFTDNIVKKRINKG